MEGQLNTVIHQNAVSFFNWKIIKKKKTVLLLAHLSRSPSRLKEILLWAFFWFSTCSHLHVTSSFSNKPPHSPPNPVAHERRHPHHTQQTLRHTRLPLSPDCCYLVTKVLLLQIYVSVWWIIIGKSIHHLFSECQTCKLPGFLVI